jgi:exosome complex protein LRP1
MDPTNLLPLLEQLDDNVDDLEEILQPLLASSLVKSSNKLPVMDKAKLHVLITYTLESLIFCMSGFSALGNIVTNDSTSLFTTPWR